MVKFHHTIALLSSGNWILIWTMQLIQFFLKRKDNKLYFAHATETATEWRLTVCSIYKKVYSCALLERKSRKFFCLWDKMLNVSSSECWPSDGRLAEWLRPPRPLQQKCPLIKYSVFVSILNFLSSTNWNWKTLIFYKEQTQLWEKIKSLLNYYTYLIVRPVNEITDYLCFAKFLFFAIFYTSTSPRHHYIHYHYFKAISASSIT